MVELENKIREIVESHLPDESLFIVDIKVSGTTQKKVAITIDGDKGVAIEQCAFISRKTGYQMEEQEIIDSAYRLEVSSPGIGQPLKMKRQYEANMGRRLEMKYPDGSKKEGKLIKVEDDFFQLEEEVKEKKKISINILDIAYDDIKEAYVIPSFK